MLSNVDTCDQEGQTNLGQEDSIELTKTTDLKAGSKISSNLMDYCPGCNNPFLKESNPVQQKHNQSTSETLSNQTKSNNRYMKNLQHIRKCLVKDEKLLAAWPFKCELCIKEGKKGESLFLSQNALNSHRNLKHSDELLHENKKSEVGLDLDRGPKKQVDSLHSQLKERVSNIPKCCHCSESFNDWKDLIEHRYVSVVEFFLSNFSTANAVALEQNLVTLIVVPGSF